MTYFQDNLQDQLNKLKRLAAERTKNLEQSKWMHAYLRESGDFEEWINEQVQTASSEEFGQDYEHLCVSLRVFSFSLRIRCRDAPTPARVIDFGKKTWESSKIGKPDQFFKNLF